MTMTAENNIMMLKVRFWDTIKINMVRITQYMGHIGSVYVIAIDVKYTYIEASM